MKRPNPEYNAGARAERTAIRRLIKDRRKNFDVDADSGDDSPELESVRAEYRIVLNAIDARVKAASKRTGGTGRK